MRPSTVLRLAAVVDGLIAVLLVATPLLRSRVGLPITLVTSAAIATGAAFLLVVAGRLDR